MPEVRDLALKQKFIANIDEKSVYKPIALEVIAHSTFGCADIHIVLHDIGVLMRRDTPKSALYFSIIRLIQDVK